MKLFNNFEMTWVTVLSQFQDISFYKLFIIVTKFKKFGSALEADKNCFPQEQYISLWNSLQQDKY
jgi:hypothetical protein